MRLRRLPPWARTSIVFAVVLAALRSSEALNFPGVEVAPLWPPTGVALAGLLLLGRATWPGVALAGLATGLWDGPGFGVLQALSLTLEASLGALLLERARFDPSLTRRRDVFALLGLGAALPALAAALLGAAGLRALGGVPADRLPFAFGSWWLGDALGVLTVAPLLLVAASVRPLVPPGRRLEALVLAVSLVGLGVLVFLPVLGTTHAPSTFAFVAFMLWAALRFGPPGASTALLVLSLLATAGTALGQGPLAVGPPVARFAFVQAFLVVTGLVGLVLAAAEWERRDALRRREEFLSIASHELKTPLTPLRIGLQLMKGHPDRAPDLIDRSIRQLDRLSGLIDGLLDVSRLGRGALAIAPTEVDLGGLVREVARRQEPAARAAHCTLALHAEEGLVGRWDRGRLEQVIGALLGNAFKFAAGSGVEVAVRREGRHARIEVRDQGAGIPAGDLERIFEEFERGRTDRALGGLGLGLFLARQLVRAHGGTLAAEAHPGKGAWFVVELPLEPRPTRPRFGLGDPAWRKPVQHAR